MNKKHMIIAISLGLLFVSAALFMQKTKAPAVKTADFYAYVKDQHFILRHYVPVDRDTLLKSNAVSYRDAMGSGDYKTGMWNAIKENYSSDHDATTLGKINDPKIKKDIQRAFELWKFANTYNELPSLIYTYMIFSDLDVQLNHYDAVLFGVTELQGVGGEKYDELIRYYNKISAR